MSAYFLDSSALVKRYIFELGSTWLEAIADPRADNNLFITRIAWVEVLSAFARRQREENLSATDVEQSVETLRYDLDSQYQVVEIDAELVETAGELVRQHPLRAYDAIQLAAALRVQSVLVQEATNSLTLLAADDRLITIARIEGLLTENPNLYS